MQFENGNLYHIYNRGNNRQPIFFNEENYLYFLRKVRQYITPVCELLAYTLMPNHFHFLIEANDKTGQTIPNTGISKSALSEGIRLLLSSYTKGVNKQQGLTGNLIQQKTKAKLIHSVDSLNAPLHYAQSCFHYIHQNAFRAGIVNEIGQWPYASFPDFAGMRNGTLCNKERAMEILNLTQVSFLEQSNAAISEEYLQQIW
jgi:REP element-mobilizing transposase RayT